MNKSISLFLDAVRFLAALTVFMDHASGQVISGSFLWQFGSYGAEAVAIFFVLSGFVIADATTRREISLSSYAVARLSRIYSVALPALVITAVADFIGRAISPNLYTEAWGYTGDLWQYCLSGLFLNKIWLAKVSPGSNFSYWSLGYEVWYYVIFSAILFLKGGLRIAVVSALLCFVGPGIGSLFPLWLVGVACHRISTAGWVTRTRGLLLLVCFIAAWITYEIIAWKTGRLLLTNPKILAFVGRPELLQDYIVGMSFAGSLVGTCAASEWIEPHITGSWSPLRWFAGMTFSLYLFHEPLLRVLATANPWSPGSVKGRALVIGGTLLLVTALAHYTERRKDTWRRFFSAVLMRSSYSSPDSLPRREMGRP
jgi:peptidoglycan/LPS O-acetylase OafA/YrhL